MKNEMLKLKNIQVKFKKQIILNDIDLSLEKGDFACIIGPNGGGKTVLLKTILGLIQPSSGEKILTSHRIGYVPQYALADPTLPINALEVVLMGLMSDYPPPHNYDKNARAKAMKSLQEVQMETLAKNHFGSLSGGQKQRVLIARALVSEPDLLLLDEPTASIDIVHAYDIYELLQKLHHQGVTILMVSHNINAISPFIDKIICLNHNLYTHLGGDLPVSTLEKVYGCNIELLGHGLPHRVLGNHQRKDPENGNI